MLWKSLMEYLYVLWNIMFAIMFLKSHSQHLAQHLVSCHSIAELNVLMEVAFCA